MSDDDTLRVICRFRPINKREIDEGLDPTAAMKILTFPNDRTIDLATWNSRPAQTFVFDKIFHDTATTQIDVYNLSARASIDDVIKGYNATIFAYGQTGAGKSFTMFGADIHDPELKGIIPRACQHIFEHIAHDTDGTEYTIKCSFLEIYKEVIHDLLNPEGRNLKVRETPSRGVWVEGLREEYVTCEQDVLNLLQLGEKYRAVSSTSMNAVSSRSHSLFILTLHQKGKDGSTKEGKLNLADLAGSEKVGKTGATGETLEEAKKINQSLSALGNCMNALTKAKRGHVPYRDSKLTFILRESLGGNCKTTLLIACSPHIFNLEETISTLMFGKRAKSIKNVATINKQRSVAELLAIIERLKKELSGCRQYIAALEKHLEALKGPNWRAELKIADFAVAIAAAAAPTADSESGDETAPTSPRPTTPGGSVGGGGGGSSSGGGDAKFYADPSMALIETQVELQKVKESTQLQIDDLQEELQTAREERLVAVQRSEQIASELSAAQNSVKELSSRLEAEQKLHAEEASKRDFDAQQQRIELEESVRTVEALRRHNDELRRKHEQVNGTIEQLADEKRTTLQQQQQLQRERDEAAAGLLKVNLRLEEMQTQIAQYEEEHAGLRSKQLQIVVENKRLQQQLSGFESKTQQLQESLRDSDVRLKERSKQAADANEQLQEMRHQLQSLEQMLAAANAELANSTRITSEVDRGKVVPAVQLEQVTAEKQQLKQLMAASSAQLKEARERLIALTDDLELAKKEQREEIENLTRLHELEVGAANVRIEVLEAQLQEDSNINKKKTESLQTKITALERLFEEETRAKSELNAQVTEAMLQVTEKESALRQMADAAGDKERELAQLRSTNEMLSKSSANQLQRLVSLEKELERLKSEKQMLQRDVDTALQINIDNAKRFEEQLENARKVEKIAQHAQVRVPVRAEKSTWASFFGGKQLPLLAQLPKPSKVGYMNKRSAWLKRWEKKWYVLYGLSLYAFENNNQFARAIDEVELDECKLADGFEFTSKPYTFGIFHHSRRDVFFMAENDSDKEEWIKAVRANISELAPPKK